MGLFKEVKCGRCDRRYSSIRSRCPYCGARKNKGGKRAVDLGNKYWQLAAGILILIAIIIAVIILVSTNLNNNEDPPTSPSGTMINDGDISTVTGTPAVSETPQVSDSAPPETPTPSAPTVVAIELSHDDVTLFYIGESFTISALLSPTSSDAKIIWSSENENIANVSQNGVVTAIGRGNVNIVCTAGGITETCIVRVDADSVSGGSTGDTGSTSGELSVSHSDVTLSVDESFTLYVSGASELPAFSSSDSDVATVDYDGTVTAVSNGTAYITASVDGVSFTCTVRVP